METDARAVRRRPPKGRVSGRDRGAPADLRLTHACEVAPGASISTVTQQPVYPLLLERVVQGGPDRCGRMGSPALAVRAVAAVGGRAPSVGAANRTGGNQGGT